MLDRGRPAVRELGPGRHRRRGAVRRAGPGRGGRRAGRGGRAGRGALRRRCPATRGSGAGCRSNGSEFTVERLGPLPPARRRPPPPGRRRGVARAATVAAYDAHADGVRARACSPLPDDGPCPVARFARSSAGRRPGARDRQRLRAATPRARGASAWTCGAPTSRRPSSTLLRADGHDADVLDPLTDDLDDPRAPGRAVRRRLGQRQPAARRARGPAGGARAGWRRPPGAGGVLHARRSRRATARAGRPTATSPRRGTSSTGASSRCATRSRPPAGTSTR